MYPEPLMRAKTCPVEMMPKAAALLVKRATAAGWTTKATVAIGFRRFGRHDSEDYRPVRSVLVRAHRNGVRLAALWVGQVDGEKMKFDGAWRQPGRLGIPDRLDANALKGEVTP